MPVAKYAASLYDRHVSVRASSAFLQFAETVQEERPDSFMRHIAVALDIVNIIFSIRGEVVSRQCFPACRVRAKLLLLYAASFKKGLNRWLFFMHAPRSTFFGGGNDDGLYRPADGAADGSR